MPRILAILVVVSFFLPFLSFASEPPAEAPAVDTISVPVYLFADDSGGILAIAPLTDELFVWTYAPLATSGMRQETGNIVGEITYDGLDRLLGATVTTQTATSSSQIVSNYTYGATGNLLTSPAGVYSYDGFSGGVFVNPHAATGVGSRALGYDSNGNLTSDTLQPGSGQAGGSANIANGWNYRNELTSTTIAQTSVSYGYDPAGQRVSLREQTGASVVSTNFPTHAYSETTLPSGTVERTVSIEAAGLPVATIRTRNTDAPKIFIMHTDHLRSTRLVTTEGAGLGNVNIVEQTDYDSFGKITRHEQTGDFAEKKKFTSHEFDQSSGYTYAKARYLDTSAGRFASQDPAFLLVGSKEFDERYNRSLESFLADPQLLNSYSYARNNPITLVDPTGESPTPASVLRSVGAKFIPIFAIASIAYDTFKPTPLANDYEMQLAQQNGNGSGANEQGNGITQGAGNTSVATAVGVVGSSAANGPNVNPGLKLGQDFGKYGKVIENTPGKITGFSTHGLNQKINKLVSSKDLLETVRNPLVTLEQAGDTTLRLTKETGVVLNPKGIVVTAYKVTKRGIIDILKLLK